MNKVTRILLAIGMILAVATPALAEFKFNGFYRLIGYVEEKKAVVDEGESQQFIDQRFRAKLTYSLNDNVSVVYFAEIDTPWGEPGSSTKYPGGQGGVSSSWAGGSDGVNIETKNVYLDLKMGDTAAMLGIQTFADTFQGIVALDDMAGVSVTHKMGGTSLKGVYSKWDEDGNDRDEWDDFDFYVVEANHAFTDSFKAGAGVYYMDDNRDSFDRELWFYGLNADAKFGDFGLNGFVVMQDGSNDLNDYDYTGWAASAKGTMKISNGDLGLRVIYFSEADDDDDDGRWQGFKGYYDFVSENQMQFLTDPYVMNDGKERYAMQDSVQAGFGLLGFVASGNHKLPSDMYLKWGLGYYMAADDTANVRGVETKKEDETLGYEVAARFGKTYLGKVDVSLNASYADYGDFYERSNGDKPDGTYKSYLMVNVPF